MNRGSKDQIVRKGLGRSLILAGMILAGCIQPVPPEGRQFQEAYEAITEGLPPEASPAGTNAAGAEIPAEVSEALLPSLDRQADPGKPKEHEEQTVDLLMSQGGVIPARDLLISLVEGSDYTMVVHPAVTVDVSLSLALKKITVPEAVDTICEMYDLDCRYEPDKRKFTIYPRRLITRTFKLDHLPVVRTGRSQTTISSGNVSQSTTEQNNTNSGTSDATTSQTTSGTDIVTEISSDFWGGMLNSLCMFLDANPHTTAPDQSPGGLSPPGNAPPETARNNLSELSQGCVATAPHGTDGGSKSVSINRQAGLVMVRALPEEVRSIDNFIQQINQRSRRQVILEAKVIEVELNDGFQFGIDWAAASKDLADFPPLATEPVDASTFESFRPITTPGGTGFPYLTELAGVLAKVQPGSPFSLAIRGQDLSVFLKMLEGQGKVQVLSSPRISTMNNEKAVIKVGSDEIFITDVTIESETTSAGISRTIQPTFTPFFSGVALDITPQIDDHGVITLHIHPMVTEVRDKIKSFTIAGTEQSYPLAFSSTRESDSVVRARDGELVVIGGLMRNSEKQSREALPVLGDIPVLGSLFTDTNSTWAKSEMVILIRPILVDSAEASANQLRSTAERIGSMQKGQPLEKWLKNW